MSMRKILRRMAKSNMRRAGMDKINRKMKANTWRRVVGAWPDDVETGKEMSHSHVGRKDNHKARREDHGMGRKHFVYNVRFGNPPPRRRFNKETGKWGYKYGPKKELGGVVSEEVS